MDPSQLQYMVSYGPDANCTLAICPVEMSIFKYRPNLAANSVFIALFGISMFIHIFQGLRYKTWFFMSAMILGCLAEMIGYGGRIMLYQNPFSFVGFMIEIVCITIAPAFFSAAIYVTLTKLVNYLEPSVSWFPPKLYYWVFIPCDLVSLILQATGGAMSSSSKGQNNSGVNISLAGLSFQVATLFIFICICIDYAFRYSKFRKTQSVKLVLPARFKLFVACLGLSIVLILVRCAYRIDELSEGYSGPLIKNEGLFIGLEGVMIIVAVFLLNVGHPGPAFETEMKRNAVSVTEISQTRLDPEKGAGGFESDSSSPSRRM